MTLNDVLQIRGRAMEKHDYEFLIGDDGLSHLVVCTAVEMRRGKPIEFLYFCPCGHFNDKTSTIGQREVATNITCMVCNTR